MLKTAALEIQWNERGSGGEGGGTDKNRVKPEEIVLRTIT